MARPRAFDETAVLDAAMSCFWGRGFEATTVKDLVETTGLNAASLYNAFGDKRALYQKVLDHYVDTRVLDRMRRCEATPGRDAIEAFFAEILARSLADPDAKGCMLVNAAIDVAPHDTGFKNIVSDVLVTIEDFFLRCVRAGQDDGAITDAIPATQLAQHLLAVLLGVRVLARVRPELTLLTGAVSSGLALLDTQEA